MAYLKGMFIGEIYSNPSNGYMVGLIRVKEASDNLQVGKVVTFTGIFNELKYKMQYKLEGEFISHSKYGLQFQTNSYEIILPTEEDEIIEFLSSDLFPIGEKTAEKIVNKLGKDTIKKILSDQNALYGIPRLTESKILKIKEVLNDWEGNSEIVIKLNKMGFSTKNSISIFKKYGNDTLKTINNNIYDILDAIDISFAEVDKIATSNGYLLDDERRLLALTINKMNELTFNNGDTYLYFDELYEYISSFTANVSSEEFTYILMKLSKMSKIKILGERYYLMAFYEAENYIAGRIVKLNNLERRKLPKLENKINQLELIMGITYDESQREAISKSLNNNLTIITGGPGTGKTTIIRCIVKLLIELLNVNPEKLALLAPTGRAARKLMDTTGLPAYTIHRYLKWDKESNSFSVNEYNPNKEEYIIVDEVSMIDTILMSSLLKGTLVHAKFIFVGDYYQLPSVSQGQVLKDLIDSDCLDVIKLNQLYRQTEDSYINTLAYEVKNKEISENFLTKYDDYNFIECSDDDILETVKDIVKKAVSKGYTDKDIQILAPLYKTKNGIDTLNVMLQEIMNPKNNDKNEITYGDTIYREGDKILQLINDNDNGVSNGDLGYIESIVSSSKTKSKKNEITINFDGTRVTYTPKDFINIKHGYAISVHKSQGGEFKLVIMPFCKSYKRMLYNKLVYTAITRAKQVLLLIGDPNAFLYGIKNDYVEYRKTSLKELLEKSYK